MGDDAGDDAGDDVVNHLNDDDGGGVETPVSEVRLELEGKAGGTKLVCAFQTSTLTCPLFAARRLQGVKVRRQWSPRQGLLRCRQGLPSGSRLHGLCQRLGL